MLVDTGFDIILQKIDNEEYIGSGLPNEVMLSNKGWGEFADALESAKNGNEDKVKITDDFYNGIITINLFVEEDEPDMIIITFDNHDHFETNTIFLTVEEADQILMKMNES